MIVFNKTVSGSKCHSIKLISVIRGTMKEYYWHTIVQAIKKSTNTIVHRGVLLTLLLNQTCLFFILT